MAALVKAKSSPMAVAMVRSNPLVGLRFSPADVLSASPVPPFLALFRFRLAPPSVILLSTSLCTATLVYAFLDMLCRFRWLPLRIRHRECFFLLDRVNSEGVACEAPPPGADRANMLLPIHRETFPESRRCPTGSLCLVTLTLP